MLDAPRRDLLVRRGKALRLHSHYFLLNCLAPAEKVQAGPGQKTRHRVEVGAEGIATDACGFKRNGPAAAEAVPHARCATKLFMPRLLHQFGQGFGVRAKVGESGREVLRWLACLKRCQVPSSSIVKYLEKDFPVLSGVRRSRHQRPQNGSPHQDERFAFPPFAQPGEGLPVVGLSLLVGLRREACDGELGFDEGGHGVRSDSRRLQVKKTEAVKGLEIGVQRNEAAARGDGQSREICIRPEAVGKSGPV